MKPKQQIDRSSAEEIRVRIITNGGYRLWGADYFPRYYGCGAAHIFDAFDYAGRVVIVHEFYNPRTDTCSAVDVYVPLVSSNRMDDTLAAIDALRSEVRS